MYYDIVSMKNLLYNYELHDVIMKVHDVIKDKHEPYLCMASIVMAYILVCSIT